MRRRMAALRAAQWRGSSASKPCVRTTSRALLQRYEPAAPVGAELPRSLVWSCSHTRSLGSESAASARRQGEFALEMRRESPGFGSVRKEWRAFMRALTAYPALQTAALETASFFTSASEIEFHLPRTFHDKYELAEKLGEGAFGHVHRVVSKTDHGDANSTLDLCVKIVPKALVVSLKDYRALQQEGKMMVLLGGTLNVVHFFGAYEDDAHVYLVMEHCVGGDVSARLLTASEQQSGARPSEAVVAQYMTDILHVVWQCHLLRILHGDLKLENFLFADAHERSPLKLTDFGGAAFLRDEHEQLRDVRGTPLYTAPEVLARHYALPSDLWSCGVILYRLLAGRFPFTEGPLLDERIQFEPIDWTDAPWPDVSPDALDLVRGLLERDVHARLSAEQALQHPWFASVRTARDSAPNTSPPSPVPPITAVLNGTLVQRLQLYRSLHRFQHAVFAELSRILPLTYKEHVVVLFSELSRDGAAQVGVDEFAAYVARGGYRLTRGEAKSFLRGLDLDGDGYLSLDEFCAALLDWNEIQTQAPALWDALVQQVFAKLDSDADGQLAVGDLARLAAFQGAPTTTHSFRNDVQRCFRDAGADASGFLSVAAFTRMLRIDRHAFAHYAQRLSA